MPIEYKNTSINLKKVNLHITDSPVTKKSGAIILASYPKKKVDKKYINSFWEKYFNGELQKMASKRIDCSVISSYNQKVKILPLSPSVAVTVRLLWTTVGNIYLERQKILKNRLKAHKLKKSEIYLADLIDYKIKGEIMYIMERIIPSISVEDIYKFDYEKNKMIATKNRYDNQFTKTISKMDKNAYDKMLVNLKKALEEIRIKNNDSVLDLNYGNLIIIDYNPESGKFKLGVIDLVGANSKSF